MSAPYIRYAVYAAPHPDSALGRFGNAWLGRDPALDGTLPRPQVPGYTQDDIAQLTEEPHRYGFHGTLKPPFRLAEGIDEAALFAAVERFAANQSPVDIDGLAVRAIGRFVAIVPERQSATLASLAASCVADLDDFRAPAGSEEMTRRRARGLSDTEERNLVRWGYPYVMAQFRFHLTLSGSIDNADRRAHLVEDLAAYASVALGPYRIDDIAIFGEPASGAPFRLLRRATLSGQEAKI